MKTTGNDPLAPSVPPLIQPLAAVVYAQLTSGGRVLAANDGFYLLLKLPPGNAVDDISPYIIHPSFMNLAKQTMAVKDGEMVLHGRLTFRDAGGGFRSLLGAACHHEATIELVAEHDVWEYQRLFSTVLRLNDELVEQQRVVVRMNRELQREREEQMALRDRLADARELVGRLLLCSLGGPADTQSVAPGPIVESAVEMMQSTIAPTLSINLTVPVALPNVRVNPALLQQIVIGLGIGVPDMAGGHGRMDIELREARDISGVQCASCGKAFGGDYVVVAVRNDGAAIPIGERSQASGLFRRTEQGGMELSTVHGLVHFNEGHVVLSTLGHGGTELELYLPATRQDYPGTPAG